MKVGRTFNHLLLIILPVVLVNSSVVIHSAQGPWYFNFYDPSYVYLINSLNLAAAGLGEVGHIDHPGTTVQIFGAIVVRITYAVAGGDPEIAKDVLLRPEFYISVINFCMNFLNGAALLLLGSLAYKLTTSITAALLLQSGMISTKQSLFALISLAPENFLLLTMSFVVMLLIYFLYKGDEVESFRYCMMSCIVCALGLVTKVIFFPVCVLFIIIIPTFRKKIQFSASMLLVAMILLIPIWGRLGEFYEWVLKLFWGSGEYGAGETTIIDPDSFFTNLVKIFLNDPLYAVSFGACSGSLIYGFRNAGRAVRHSPFFNRVLRLQFGIFIAMTLQTIMVAKHYKQMYMLTALLLSVPSLFFSIHILFAEGRFRVREISRVLSLALFLVSALCAFNLIDQYFESREQGNEAQKISNFVRDSLPDGILIPAFQSADKDCALFFAVGYSGGQREYYSAILREEGAKDFYYDPWGMSILTLGDNDLKDHIDSGKRVFFQLGIFGEPQEFVRSAERNSGIPGFSYRLITENKYDERIYELITEPFSSQPLP